MRPLHRRFLGWLAAGLAAPLLALCVSTKPAPQAIVRIVLSPTAKGITASYGLSRPSTHSPFRKGAGDIRTETWTTPTPGARLKTMATTFGIP